MVRATIGSQGGASMSAASSAVKAWSSMAHARASTPTKTTPDAGTASDRASTSGATDGVTSKPAGKYSRG
jgi:hypothetical protein